MLEFKMENEKIKKLLEDLEIKIQRININEYVYPSMNHK